MYTGCGTWHTVDCTHTYIDFNKTTIKQLRANQFFENVLVENLKIATKHSRRIHMSVKMDFQIKIISNDFT